jgi:putative transcriptional regulator
MSDLKRTQSGRNRNSIRPAIAEMLEGGRKLIEELDAGVPLEQAGHVTWITAPIEPARYGPEELRAMRAKLGATQADLAAFIGVSLPTVRSWEQGTRPCPKVVRRYLDDIQSYPQIWTDRMNRAV